MELVGRDHGVYGLMYGLGKKRPKKAGLYGQKLWINFRDIIYLPQYERL
jgi:hypothetical protein